METKIPFYRFVNNMCDCSGDYIGEMMQVTFDDLLCLEPTQLNVIPTSWICDWANIGGHIRDPRVRQFINGLFEERTNTNGLRLSLKNAKIEFIEEKQDVKRFAVRNGRNIKTCDVCNRTCYVDSVGYALTDKQVEKFRQAYKVFEQVYKTAQNGSGGFMSVESDKEMLYLRRTPSFDYQFIVARTDSLITKTCSVYDYFKSDIYNPSIDVSDAYFMTELKFCRKQATTQDVEYLNEFDGKNRIIADDKIYRIEDIRIKSSKLLPKSFFHCIDEYALTIEINNVEYSAVYLSGNIININGYHSSASVVISNELRERITNRG